MASWLLLIRMSTTQEGTRRASSARDVHVQHRRTAPANQSSGGPKSMQPLAPNRHHQQSLLPTQLWKQTSMPIGGSPMTITIGPIGISNPSFAETATGMGAGGGNWPFSLSAVARDFTVCFIAALPAFFGVFLEPFESQPGQPTGFRA